MAETRFLYPSPSTTKPQEATRDYSGSMTASKFLRSSGRYSKDSLALPNDLEQQQQVPSRDHSGYRTMVLQKSTFQELSKSQEAQKLGGSPTQPNATGANLVQVATHSPSLNNPRLSASSYLRSTTQLEKPKSFRLPKEENLPNSDYQLIDHSEPAERPFQLKRDFLYQPQQTHANSEPLNFLKVSQLPGYPAKTSFDFKKEPSKLKIDYSKGHLLNVSGPIEPTEREIVHSRNVNSFFHSNYFHIS